MINLLPESEGATIGIEVLGKIEAKEEKEWIVKFDKLIEQNKKINVLILLDGKVSFGADVVYEDLTWMLKHVKDFNKLAFVSDSRVLRWLVAMDSPFANLLNVTEKHFESSQLQQAWSWIKA